MLGLTIKKPSELSKSKTYCLSVSFKELLLLEQWKLQSHHYLRRAL